MTSEEYREAIGALARGATMPADAAARMEARLGEAFEPAAATSEKHVRRHSASKSLAAVAAIAVMVAAGAWYAVGHRVTSNNVTPAPAPEAVPENADLPSSPAPRRTAVGSPEAGRSERKLPKKLPAVVRPEGFAPIPTAAALPQFESGSIVRVSLPVTALPSYGVDISPAASGEPVEADVLVGQDGLARAIRLVNTSRSQQ